MDYHKLFSELPKQPIKWTVNDIEVWLRFIGLNSLYPKFKQLSIDGSCLNSLTEDDLRDQLHIKSGITVKKIMSWISRGLVEYDQFIKVGAYAENNELQMIQVTHKSKKMAGQGDLLKQISSNHMISEQTSLIRPVTVNKVIEPNRESIKYEVNNKKCENVKYESIKYQNNATNEAECMVDQNEENKKQYELIIQQCDGNQTSFFSVKQEGAKIGRHSSNQILILDESISRFHAQIKFHEGIFLLRDTGSTTGTFLKITQKVEIFPEMIIQMGSNQFQAHLDNDTLTLQIIQGPSQGNSVLIPKHNKISIGRKQTNLLNFPDDQHLSNIHATIYYIAGRYELQDLGTTNGTWQRLSFEGEGSDPYELFDKTIFKIGSSQTYCCRIKTAYVSQRPNPNACIICYENDKDCVYMPCKHNTACIRCSKNLKECPICRIKIQDYVRIYKS